MNRQQRRLLEKKIGAKTTKDLGDQISLFHKLPDLCSSCQEHLIK